MRITHCLLIKSGCGKSIGWGGVKSLSKTAKSIIIHRPSRSRIDTWYQICINIYWSLISWWKNNATNIISLESCAGCGRLWESRLGVITLGAAIILNSLIRYYFNLFIFIWPVLILNSVAIWFHYSCALDPPLPLVCTVCSLLIFCIYIMFFFLVFFWSFIVSMSNA